MKTSAHITLTTATHESRLEKEALSLIEAGIVARVIVYARHGECLPALQEKATGLTIHRLSLWTATLPKSAGFQAIKLLEFFLRVWLHLLVLRPAYISVHSYALLPLGALGKWTTPARLVYDTHELETEVNGMSGLRKRTAKWIERRFVQQSDLVFVVTDPIREWYEASYGLKDVHVVRNVPQKDAIKIRQIPGGGVRERFGIPESATVFIYQGLFAASRGIEKMIETFSLIDPHRHHLVLMGYGDEQYQAIIDNATRRCSNVHCQPAVPREWIVSFSASADVALLVPDGDSLSYKYSLPNKFFEWTNAGIPIIMSENLEYQASLVTKNGLGWVTSQDGLIDVIDRLTPGEIARHAENTREFSQSAVWENEAKILTHAYLKL